VTKKFIQNILPGIIYLLIYIFFRNAISLSEPTSISILMVIIIVVQMKLGTIIKSIKLKTTGDNYTKVEKAVHTFSERLNDISHYHELFPEFYNLFNSLFTEKTWLFYIFEDSGFRMIKFDTSKTEDNLPEEIKIDLSKRESNFINLNEINDKIVKDSGFSPSEFQKNHLDVLIPISGKNQIVALLFASSSDIDFINNQDTADKLKKSLARAGPILENTALYLDIVQKNLETKKLLEVSKKILTSLNTEDILDFLLDSLAEVITFDAAVIFLFDPETKKLYRKVSKGYNEKLDLTLKFGQGASGWVAKTRKVSLIRDIQQAEHYYPIRPLTRSQVSIPLEMQDELIGVLTLESNLPGHYNNHSIEILNIFANQAVIALHNAKQYEISQTKQSLEHELIKAGKVQQVLLPQRPPSFANLTISFYHQPSALVSGDLFDLVPIDQNTLGLVIGDVSGKGAGAAIMMSLVLAGFRAYKKSQLAVCEVVAHLNNLLEESVSTGNYATLFYALISTSEDSITYTNAGHNPPIIFRKDGSVEELSVGGIVLGYLANQVYSQQTIPFQRGDLLLSFTDGITETQTLDGEEFGVKRLISLVQKNRGLNIYDLKEKILEEVNQFTDSSIISDDRTIVIVKY
jgi:sigma-B regulation protein RsbU (phosphoserine phosphatase)